jgi:aminotransferase
MNLPTNRMKNIPFSGGIREILSKAYQMEKEGKNIIHLEIGRPDFGSPEVAVEELIKSIRSGQVHYCDISGVEELRVAIAEEVKKTLGIDANPDNEIVIGVGAVEGLVVAMTSLLDIGDEIILLTPCFPAYFDQAYLTGVVPVAVPLRMENNFKLDIDELRRKITPNTKMILINSPNNPTGMVYSLEDLKKIAEIAIENDLYVLSDEAYSEFFYDEKHISIASLPGMRERTIIVNTTSKAYSMTGWRVGYMLSSPEIMKYMHKTHQNFTTQPSTFAQYGAVAAYKYGRPWTEMMLKEFRKRRDLVMSYLDEIDGIEYVKPEGAFYVYPSIEKLGMTSDEFCDYIINEAGVALVPGDAFRGQPGRSFVRIAYANSYENIEEAMKRIKTAVEKIKKK